MKFIKFLSLIAIISCAQALYSMEKGNTSQEQSRVPKLADLCRQKRIEQINPIINEQWCAKPNTCEEAVELLNQMNKQFSIATHGLADGLYNSNEIFQHCIDLIINEIWNQCQRVTGTTLDKIIGEIKQNLHDNIPKELLPFIKVHFCKQKGWHVPYCLKEFNNVAGVNFSPNSLLMFVKDRDGRGELINAKTREVIKEFDNVDRVDFLPNGSLMFVRYRDDRGELINAKTGAVIKEFNYVSWANFSLDNSLMFVRYGDNRGELIDAKTGNVIKEFNNFDRFNFSPNSSLMFVKYLDNRGELIDARSGAVIKDNVLNVNFSPDSSLMLVSYGDGRGELLCTGNFEQIIFKCALRNTLQAHKEQQSDEIKQGLTALLNHQIFKTFPQQAQKQLSKDIIDVLKSMGLEFRGLTGILLNNFQQPKRIVRRI